MLVFEYWMLVSGLSILVTSIQGPVANSQFPITNQSLMHRTEKPFPLLCAYLMILTTCSITLKFAASAKTAASTPLSPTFFLYFMLSNPNDSIFFFNFVKNVTPPKNLKQTLYLLCYPYIRYNHN